MIMSHSSSLLGRIIGLVKLKNFAIPHLELHQCLHSKSVQEEAIVPQNVCVRACAFSCKPVVSWLLWSVSHASNPAIK